MPFINKVIVLMLNGHKFDTTEFDSQCLFSFYFNFSWEQMETEGEQRQ